MKLNRSFFFSDELLDLTDSVNALINISDSQLDDQLLELEKLTTIDNSHKDSTNSKTGPTASNSGDNLVELLESAAEHEKIFSDMFATNPSASSNSSVNQDLLGLNSGNHFDSEWIAAFTNSINQPTANSFQTPSTNSSDLNSFLPSSLLSELLTSANKTSPEKAPSTVKSKPTGKSNEKSNWLNLFAELDPIQNPDAIGKSAGDEADRSC